MDKFLDAYNQPKLNQEDIKYLNSPITCNEIEAVTKSLSRKKSQGPDEFTAKFHQTFKEEPIPIPLKLFQEIEREGTFYKASFTLIPKPNKDNQKRELQTNVFNEYRCQDSQQNTGKQNSTTHQKDHTP
jgi:hypothetical protein